jgi:hypothetical protein
MRLEVSRKIFAVIEDGDGWAVESGGAILERRGDKDEAKAAAHRRARSEQDAGRPCMVRVNGEHGFTARADRDSVRGAPAVRPGSRFLPKT